MRKKRVESFLLAIALALSVPTTAAAFATPLEAATPVDAKKVTKFLDEFFAREDVKRQASAAGVSIVYNGKIVVEKAYGVMDRSTMRPVDTEHTTFRIASVSKVFTAVALMQLVEQGKVSLDDNIEKYLDGFKVTNPYDKPVTIAMLLTHTTGFEVRDPTDANLLFDPSLKPISLKESIFKIFPPVVREPGTSYMYDNFAYALQGYIIEKVSGMSFSDYTQKQIFEPLGMNSSSYLDKKELLERLPTVYDDLGKAAPAYRLSPEVIPEGGMNSTVSDMSKFMIAFLNEGKIPGGKQILTEKSVKEMSVYRSEIHPDLPDTTYGFESPIDKFPEGYHVISKLGNGYGYNAGVWLLPEQETGIFLAHNTDNSVLYRQFIKEYMEEFYPGQPKLGDKGFKAQPLNERKKFEGIYSDLRVGSLIAVRANEDGTLTVGNKAGVQKRLKQTDELLFVDEEGTPMAFKLDEEGNVEYVKDNDRNPFSYGAKLPEKEVFTDVPDDHPYATYINRLHALGIIESEQSGAFGTQQTVTREQFIHELVRQFNFKNSDQPLVFADIGQSPYKVEIQAAVDLGLLEGYEGGFFRPEEPIKREEAALIVQRLLVMSGYKVKESATELTEGTSKWANSAVKTMVDLKIHGPEVVAKEGQANYGSQRELTKQELAAIMYLLVFPEVSLLQ
ncbi:serine hydrolase [Paenibacillus elgii]|uniref:serine hydrolase n=1 Tax=Paenibacillus elgii TaxID=189691 RepID=UPI00030A9C88|nr:serine hydrolase [Paenibacillus elgii]